MAVSRTVLFAAWLAASVLATLSDAGANHAAAQGRLEAHYMATLFGIPLGEISWTLDLKDNHYSATASGRITGLVRIFADGHGTVTAHGVISLRRTIAAFYALNVVAGESSDEVKILFDGGKAKEYLGKPQTPSATRIPLTEASRVGVVDPMTALLLRIPGVGDGNSAAACERKVAVFDGRLRYDLQLAFKRTETAHGETGYQGAVVVCSVYFSPLAGYEPDRFATKYLRAQRGMEIWLVPLAGTQLMVPYRASVPTPMGLGVLQATRFNWSPQARSSAMN